MSASILLLFLMSVRGVVVDPSARPVQGAEVRCGGRVASTDSTGHFEFPGLAACEAAISKSGFEPRRVALGDNESSIALALAVRSDRVLVSATRAPIALEEAGVAADVYTARDFEQRQYPLLSEFLRDSAGVALVKSGRNGALTSLFTRGGQSSATLVMLDGVPLTEPGGSIHWAHLDSSGLDRVEVVRGPESALFGAEASSGVIQIFTRRGDAESRVPHGAISYERGSFSTDRWLAALNGGLLSRIDYSLAADQLRTTGEFPNDFYRNTTGTANLGFRFTDATRLRAVFRMYDADAGTPDQVGYGIIDRDAHEDDRDAAVSIRLDDARGRRYVQAATFGYHRYRYNFVDERIDGPYSIAALVRQVGARVYLERLVSPSTAAAEPGTRLVKQSVTLFPFPGAGATERATAGYQGTLTHRGGALVFGYAYDRQSGDISTRGVVRQDNGLYVHEQYAVTPRVFVAAGARLERSSTFGTKFAPRAAASVRLPGDVWLRASAARGILEPSLIQNYAAESFFVGNLALRPEKTASYEAGLSREWLSRRLRTGVALFRNSFRDLIFFDFAVFPGTWRNLERSWARGLESTGELRLASWLTARAAYTRLFTRVVESSQPNSLRTGVGQELLRRPGNSAAFSLALAPRRWTLVAGARLVGERQDADLFGVTRNPGYQHVYVAGSWQAAAHVTPFLRVENLLNQRYSEVLGYPALSRSVLGGVRVTW